MRLGSRSRKTNHKSIKREKSSEKPGDQCKYEKDENAENKKDDKEKRRGNKKSQTEGGEDGETEKKRKGGRGRAKQEEAIQEYHSDEDEGLLFTSSPFIKTQ